MKFALTGASGYVAPRHMKAIKEVAGDLIVALDPNDSVGILDSYFPECKFFVDTERFDRYLAKLYYNDEPIDYFSVCSPNYLHDAHCRLGMRAGANIICEKPLVINPWNLDQLKEMEIIYNKRINVVLQLRLHPEVVKLKESVDRNKLHKVEIRYITPRGPWYDVSWKGDASKSGGVLANIGIHFFDMLIWLFGDVEGFQLSIDECRRCAGILYLESAVVKWFLSINKDDLSSDVVQPNRSITIDGQELRFDKVFTDLHTDVYKNVLFGPGFSIDDATPSIELVYKLRNS
jgi:UDP-N-acetyl-2-amino-2-deoxyglucuronate dehydrogenase